MSISQNLPKKSLKMQSKDNQKIRIAQLKFDKHYYPRQIDSVLAAFSAGAYTMLEVARLTGIERAGICRYVATLTRSKKIRFVGKSICSISIHKAGRYAA